MMQQVISYPQRMLAHWQSLRSDETGASMVEYGLLLAFIAIVVIVGVAFFGTQLDNRFVDIGSSVSAVS